MTPNVRCVTCGHGPNWHEVDGEELRACMHINLRTGAECACKQYVCWYKREAEERERLDELRRTGE